MTPPPAVPAATLVLFRPGADGAAEVLMVERGRRMAFAAGAMVFPGGRVDPGDRALATDAFPSLAADEGAARVAAVRETIEEVGIAVGLTPRPAAGTTMRVRAGLAAGEAFAALLDAEGLRFDPDALTPFARWRPEVAVPRVFDTRFFLAEVAADATAMPDGGETVRALWATPRALLLDADAGRLRMIYPTRRNLERLASLGSFGAARAQAAAIPVAVIIPFHEVRDGEEWLCIPDDRGYPITGERLADVRRG